MFGRQPGMASRPGLISGARSAQPMINANLLGGSLGPVTHTRTGSAWHFNNTGTLVEAAAGAPRFDHDPIALTPRGLLVEPAVTNSIRNPRGEGAVPGAPGTAPTNWSVTAGSGISSEIVGTGNEGGMPYTDVRFFGTATAVASLAVRFDSAVFAAALTGQVWTSSVYVRLMAGSWGTPLQNPQINIQEANAGGTFLGQFVNILSPLPTTSSLRAQRYSSTATLAQATTAFSSTVFFVQYNTGAVVDFTVRFGAPQLCQFHYATSIILPPVGTPGASTRNADTAQINIASFPFLGSDGYSVEMDFSIIGYPTGTVGMFGVSIGNFSDVTYYQMNNTGGISLAKRVASAGNATAFSSTVALNTPGKLNFSDRVADLRGGSYRGVSFNAVGVAGIPAHTVVGLLKAPWTGPTQVAGHIRGVKAWSKTLPVPVLQASSNP